MTTNCPNYNPRDNRFNVITKLSDVQFYMAPLAVTHETSTSFLSMLIDGQPYTRIWMELTLIMKQMELEGENVQRQTNNFHVV